MICAQLLGKLLADLASMREESIATAGLRHVDDDGRAEFVADVTAAMKTTSGNGNSGKQTTNGGSAPAAASAASAVPSSISKETQESKEGEKDAENKDTDIDTTSAIKKEDSVSTTNEGDAPAGGEHDGHDGDDDAVLHRLCPTYAQDINSPLRHVRTRIYFTSESHCHSLVNVLRYCQLGLGAELQHGLLSDAGQRLLHGTSELDYMTHIVFRMFERKKLPLNDPGRFRVEILFSPGAAHDPYGVVPLRRDHVIPIVPRMAIQDAAQQQGAGVPLARLEQATKPYAKPFKAGADPYALRSVAVTSQVSEVDYWM
jgi:inositol hexakisphosphate/diphosphoinositol-pentakisphosphate kinase